ncbi:MAG: flagellar motor switch protein FliN [Deltaproteobacteria bacterium]|nr:flagellar motor switch protein FliN [Deltaproteobacteria bacterium]|tara:strand:+ start:2332 stop:2628 length:297 start_codon:yes stop_codon:yes gene_type:complete
MSNDSSAEKSLQHKLDFLADAQQVLQAEIARSQVSLYDVMLWKQGTVVKFDKILGSTIDVLIGERLIARGEVVIVNDRYGVRINEITHPDEKPYKEWK